MRGYTYYVNCYPSWQEAVDAAVKAVAAGLCGYAALMRDGVELARVNPTPGRSPAVEFLGVWRP